MGRHQRGNNSKSCSAMDIDPRPSWNNLCPSYIEAHRNKLMEEESNGPVIGSPPPAGPPRVSWDGNYPDDVPKHKSQKSSKDQEAIDAADLSNRVQDIRLQPPQPIIICETVEDVKTVLNESGSASSVSLAVPPVDISNEKKRPPLSAPY
ncbi:uncharacterized protein LOC129959063 [Argiope bruennichi]|uniref:Uncharacterized protein n=1 Tax=Argiope bruennichi TaxID=94029 RepID=A0A8T0F477_ARGBR|nr:uncharacterized protein LOC129959063 [Argiope bruennichi]XP_055927833.1 uncharacterized protein LOC129959063 [Argiope bruennichi]KAF8785068.1 hypothetical protein HNY73_010662 [Argiope bruennichi]